MAGNIFINGIKKTGFILENIVAGQLKMHNWTVISNKYYEDDFEGSVREIDLLAYKVATVQNIKVYTVILVSCKKNDANAWVLLSRKVDIKDPNVDWYPLHTWSNDYSICYESSKDEYSPSYYQFMQANDVKNIFNVPKTDVFAFQEMDIKSGAPKNDKNIFNSITSLMKAQTYEIGALPSRKEYSCVYQFNLVSVIDSDLIRLDIDGDEINAVDIECEDYILRYILNKKETFSRILFVKASSFENIIDEYDALHTSNCVWFDKKIEYFYSNVLEVREKRILLVEAFVKMLRWPLRSASYRAGVKLSDSDQINIGWGKSDSYPTVYLPVGDDDISLFRDDNVLNVAVAKALESIYRYKGSFVLESDLIPF